MPLARILKTEKSVLSVNTLNTFSSEIDAENMSMFLSPCRPNTSSWFKNLSVIIYFPLCCKLKERSIM